MSEVQKVQTLTDLYDQAYVLLQKIPEIKQLDDLVLLCCSTLNASLFINDPQGNIIVHSSFEDAPCPSWTERIKRGRVQNAVNSIYADNRNLRPMSNTLRHDKCSIEGCTRLYFPLHAEDGHRPNILNLFIWHTEVTQREQAIAAIFAGAFSSMLMRQELPAITLHEKQVHVICELLDYKAGLKNYYLRTIMQSGLKGYTMPFRILCIRMNEAQLQQENLLILEIAHRLPQAWCFAHDANLVAVFNEEEIPVSEMLAALSEHIARLQMTACLSMPFYDLLRLRYTFEDCCSVLPVAAQKEPDTRIHLAERYQCHAFLSRCRQYFPLQDYYPESLTRLMEHDRETGRSYLITLTAYLENNMNASAAAKSIFMHRNTMMQQLEKIEQIMGVSLQDKDLCLYLQMCLKIHELLNL